MTPTRIFTHQSGATVNFMGQTGQTAIREFRNSDLPEFSLPEFRTTEIQFTGIHRNSRIHVCPIKFTVRAYLYFYMMQMMICLITRAPRVCLSNFVCRSNMYKYTLSAPGRVRAILTILMQMPFHIILINIMRMPFYILYSQGAARERT